MDFLLFPKLSILLSLKWVSYRVYESAESASFLEKFWLTNFAFLLIVSIVTTSVSLYISSVVSRVAFTIFMVWLQFVVSTFN